MQYNINEDDELEPVIIGSPNDQDTNEEPTGIYAERAIAMRLISISDQFNLKQIVSMPSFRKTSNEQSYFDIILSTSLIDLP